MNYGTIHSFIGMSDELAKSLKVAFNDNHGKVLQEYLNDRASFETRSVLWYTGKQLYKVGDVFLSLLRISGDDWILTSIHRVTEKLEVKKGVDSIGWKSEILPEYEKFYGTLHVNFHRGRDNHPRVMFYPKVEKALQVSKLETEPYAGEDFPGCDKVKNLSGEDLLRIFNSGKSSWATGLSSSKAIYLIRDKLTGKMYVGSAASDDEMLYSRWRAYAKNGHGGNKIFKQIVERSGIDYVRKNFEYSILEPHDYREDTNFLIERENHWKEMLHTRESEGGMNLN